MEGAVKWRDQTNNIGWWGQECARQRNPEAVGTRGAYPLEGLQQDLWTRQVGELVRLEVGVRSVEVTQERHSRAIEAGSPWSLGHEKRCPTS